MEAAERALRAVIVRAEAHGVRQLQAEASRDLALLLSGSGRHVEAAAVANAARATFKALGAERELRKAAKVCPAVAEGAAKLVARREL